MGDSTIDEHAPRRRLSATDLADSPVLKLIQAFIMMVLVPLVGWGGGKVLDRMDRIEQALAAGAVTQATLTATNDLRLKNIEVIAAKWEAEMRELREKQSQTALKIELMDARRR